MRTQLFTCPSGDGDTSVLVLMRRAGILLSADCGGRGTCRKCRVRFLSGAPDPDETEKKKLSERDLAEGYRLACRCRPAGPFTVEYCLRDESIAAESIACDTAGENGQRPVKKTAAVDVGTTTIAAALVDTAIGSVLDVRTGVNHQRAYGADVISRIQASNEGKGEALRQIVRADLDDLISAMGEDPAVIPTVIAGNSTMQHLLQGLSCRTLGVAPFTPVDLSLHRRGNYLYLPGISTYVGADIVAGIVSTGMDRQEEISMLIDLGTNGEMALGNKDRILAASTAAGPAFEGGNISCGVAGIPGAVSRVTITGGQAVTETIGGLKPVGLCGTGVLEVMFELLKEGIVDETGLMDEMYEDEGFPVAEGIFFTDRDVREVQLAKAAIHAGALTLIREYGISCEEISHLYLAGGFGQQIDLVKAAGIGLLPEELVKKASAVGNSSLKGAVLAAASPEIRERFERAVQISKEVSLADSIVFSELFIESMYFA